MFRKYSEQGLLDLDDWWWLITPYAGYSSYVQYVDTDGMLLYDDAYHGSGGVRPALYVDSEIEVEVDLLFVRTDKKDENGLYFIRSKTR